MKTVLHVITGLQAGGAEQMLTRIASYPSYTYPVRQIVVSLVDRGFWGDELEAANVELHTLDIAKNGLFKSVIRLFGIIQRTRPDIAISWLYHADFVLLLASVFCRPKKLYWNIRCSNMDFSKYSWLTFILVKILSWFSGRPDGIIYNSEAGRQAHMERGYRPRQWHYLPNGFNLAQLYPDDKDRQLVRRELGFSCNTIVIGMIARVDPQKDHDTFFRALAILEKKALPIHVVLVGKGTRELAAAMGQSFTVPVSGLGVRKDVPFLLRGLDIIVLTSSYGEGFPNVLGEAMATGIRCVATDVGDAAKVLGPHGQVTAIGDHKALAQAITLLSEESHEVACKKGVGARDYIRDYFSLEAVASQYEALWI